MRVERDTKIFLSIVGFQLTLGVVLDGIYLSIANEHVECKVCQALFYISVLQLFYARTVSVVFKLKRLYFGGNLDVYSNRKCTV